MKTLSNKQLTIQVKELGAELCSIKSNATGREYLWQADPTYWKRHSPVLFPIVGAVWNNEYRHNGNSYPLSQHGFARDRMFTQTVDKPDEIRFRLDSDDESLKLYPFSFSLEIGYRLSGNQVEVIWSVKNAGSEELYFQIGAHPAFYYPDYSPENDKRGYFTFDKTTGLKYVLIGSKGCVAPDKYPLSLDEKGMLPLDTHTFDKDALIFEDGQLGRVALLDGNREAVVTLHFTAPVVGLWSPPSKNAPFICIEPWYGRCDRVDYAGEYKDKDWIQYLQPGEQFNASYRIEVNTDYKR